MRKFFLWAIVIIVAALLQATWLEAITLHGVMPDLILALMVYAAIAEGEERAMLVGALGGVLQDVAGSTGLGHHVLSHVIVGYAAGRLATRLVTEHPGVKVGLVFLACIVDGVLFLLIDYVRDPHSGALQRVFENVVPEAFYTAIITPFIFLLLDRSFRRSAPATGGL